MTAKLMRLDKAVDIAHERLNDAFEREFPVGSHISWLFRDRHRQYGVVEYNRPFGNCCPEMRVLNDKTGKLVWVALSHNPARL